MQFADLLDEHGYLSLEMLALTCTPCYHAGILCEVALQRAFSRTLLAPERHLILTERYNSRTLVSV